MNKPPAPPAAPYAGNTTYAGVDVSKDHVEVCCFDSTGSRRTRRFPNTPAGQRALLGWLGSAPAQIVVESTGRYGLDLTLALHTSQAAEVMVANPKALRGFAKAQMRRTKTDAVDAEVIADYARRMPFEAWKPPTEAIRDLQAIARRIHALSQKSLRHRSGSRAEPSSVNYR